MCSKLALKTTVNQLMPQFPLIPQSPKQTFLTGNSSPSLSQNSFQNSNPPPPLAPPLDTATALACNFSSNLNLSLANQKNSTIKWWGYRLKEAFKTFSFFVNKETNFWEKLFWKKKQQNKHVNGLVSSISNSYNISPSHIWLFWFDSLH